MDLDLFNQSSPIAPPTLVSQPYLAMHLEDGVPTCLCRGRPSIDRILLDFSRLHAKGPAPYAAMRSLPGRRLETVSTR